MKKMGVLFILGVVIVGCGGGSGSDTSNSNNEPTVVSNTNYNKNQYGYYGDNVIFGNKKIQGKWYSYGINKDGTLHNFPNKMEFYDDEFFGEYNKRRTSLGSYGVSEDGKILTTHYELFNKDITYQYIEEISVKNNYTNVQQICMKVHSSFEDVEYYAFCK